MTANQEILALINDPATLQAAVTTFSGVMKARDSMVANAIDSDDSLTDAEKAEKTREARHEVDTLKANISFILMGLANYVSDEGLSSWEQVMGRLNNMESGAEQGYSAGNEKGRAENALVFGAVKCGLEARKTLQSPRVAHAR